MGDKRFDPVYERLRGASDRADLMRTMTDVEVVQALAAASRARDPLLANVLATEAENRMRRAGIAAARAPECIIALDAHGRVTYANEAALALLRCRRRDLVGRIVWEAVEVFSPDGERIAPEARPSYTALHDMREARGEVYVRCSDGKRIRCIYLAAPIATGGVVDGAVVVFHRY